MRKENSEFNTSFVSEAGSFIRNSDYFAYIGLDDIACWVVVQGLDSDTEVSSAELAAKAVLEKFMEKPSMSRRIIKSYLKHAHEILQSQSLRVRLKASMIVVVTNYTKMKWAVSGHARLYHFQNERLLQQSKDQSLAQELANEMGVLEGVDQHEERHNLLHYVGKPDQFRPFISKKQTLQDGDVLLLCTSGFWEEVKPVEMAEALEEMKEPEDYVGLLEEVLLSRQKKVVNPYTLAAIFVNKVYVETKMRHKKLIKTIAIALVLALLVGGGTIFYKVKEAKRNAEYVTAVFEHDDTGDLYFQDENYEGALKEYSEGRNAAKRTKNPVHLRLLGSKLRVTQFIIDGDEKVTEGAYSEALTKYEKGLKEAKKIPDFDVTAIETKVANIDVVVAMMDTVKEGDFLSEAEDYAGALRKYENAKKQALEISYSGIDTISKKMEEAEGKLAELEAEKKGLEAERLEKKGDQSYANYDYNGAIDSYNLAQEIFDEIGLVAKVLNVERKIMNAEDKLNPTPSPTATEQANDAPVSVPTVTASTPTDSTSVGDTTNAP